MLFGMVSGVGQGLGVLDEVSIVEGEGAVLWVNLEHPIVTNGSLLHSYVEVRELIELLFGVVSGVG